MADAPIYDAHLDLLYELWQRSDLADPFGDLWLAQLRDGGVRLQVCPLYADPGTKPKDALEVLMRQAAAFHRAAREHPDEVVVVRTREDLAGLELDGRLGLLLSLEGAEGLAEELDLVDVLWELGVRMVGPFWAESNAFGDGNAGATHGGLTALGRELVARVAARGFIVDLAHCSDASFADMLRASAGAPVMVSHTGCRALYDSPRNSPDEHLTAIADRGGVVGIFALPPFMDPAGASLDALVDQLEHAVTVAGEGHVGLGGDFVQQLIRAGLVEVPAFARPAGMPFHEAIEGVGGPADYPVLLRALRDRGLADSTVASLAGGALRDFLSRSLPTADETTVNT